MMHALVVGSQIEGLRGVHNDTRAMAELLRRRGFAVDLRIERDATRAGILAGYDELIACSGPEDAAVVYYSGHGFHTAAADAPSGSWQCIAPTDVNAGSDSDWRGITAWELSIKQTQLTARTRNTTVILDACHSAQMSRDAAVREAIPRALPHPVRLGLRAHLDQLRALYPAAFHAVDPLGNPHAVRLVACGQTESAFEYCDAAGDYHGAFTSALIEVLGEVGDAPLSWAALAGAIRSRVQRSFLTQRPTVEGPARRRLFSLSEDDSPGVPLSVAGDQVRLHAGQLTGVVRGDVYGVMPAGSTAYARSRALAELEVVEVRPVASIARRASGGAPLPVDAVAFPIRQNAVRRGVVLDVPATARETLERAIGQWPTLRVTAAGDSAAVATLRLEADRLTIEDARGPLFPAAHYSQELDGTVKNLANLGVAQAVRELEGEHGVFAGELEIELGAVDRGLPRPLPDHGSALGLGDRIYIKLASRSQRRLYVHVFNVGVRRTVTSLTARDAAAGIALDRGDPHVLGRRADGTLVGLGLTWPVGLPRDTFPRIDELVVIATTEPADLTSLETRDFIAVTRSAGGGLADRLAQLQDGAEKDMRLDDEPPGYHAKRLSYLLHPRDAAMMGTVFEIDDNPGGQLAAREPEAWFAARKPEPWLARGAQGAHRSPVPPPAPAPSVPDAPGAIAVRIADLIVENNRALGSADVRVDALICTRSPDPGGGYATWTQRFSRIADGERLALENGLLFLGPVRDFVDITLFVSRDTSGSLALSKLFAGQAASPAFRDAAGALLHVAGASAAPWVAAVGASAVLAHMAHELVLGVAGKSIGLYRTSFLRRERFGVGRHPPESLYRAKDFSFSLVIEPVELQAAAG